MATAASKLVDRLMLCLDNPGSINHAFKEVGVVRTYAILQQLPSGLVPEDRFAFAFPLETLHGVFLESAFPNCCPSLGAEW